LLKRTAAITQAGLGSQIIRSGTAALKTLRCVIKVAYMFASVKAITVKFLVCVMATSDHNMTSSKNSEISSEPTLKKQTVRVADVIQADKDMKQVN